VQNETPVDIPAYLHVNYSQLDNIQLFHSIPGSPSHSVTLKKLVETGDRFNFAQRPIEFPTFVLPLELSAGQPQEYFVKVSSEGSLQVPLQLWEQESFLLQANNSLFLYGCFLSALLIMSAYNLCLFLIIRDKTYLLYSFFILCMAGMHSSLDGFAYQWFWPSAPSWHQISAITFISFGLLSTMLFTRTILPIPEKSILYRGIKLLTFLTVVSAITSLFLPYRQAAILNGGMTVIVMSSVTFICLAMLRFSPRIARFFCIAWGAYFLGIVLKSSSKMGYLPSSTFTEYAGNIGGVVGIVIISMALADRINSERRAREQAQSQSIGNLKRFENLYQNSLEGIFSYDKKGTLLSANPAFLSLIGLEDIPSFSGKTKDLNGYYLSEKEFTEFFKAVKKSGQVVDYEAQLSNSLGDSMWVNISARYVNEQGNEELEGTLININERKAFEQQLKHLAEHDSLTGFYNRRTFESSAKELLLKVQAGEDSACLLYMDLDQFKIVNDLCGHTAGDILLKNISQKLLQEVKALGPQQVIARLGGDEFGILVSQTSLPKARLIAESLREAVEKFLFIWEGKRYSIGVSIGLVEIYPYHQNVEQLLAMADAACYMAKDQGRNRVHVFIESDKDLQFRQLEMQWVTTIKEALTNDQFFLVFQHIAPNQGQEQNFHYEILLRLINSNGNLCSPGQFLPAAERYNLMPNIDRWVIKNYFAWLGKHPEHLEKLGCASINLSPQSIGQKEFSAFLVNLFEENKVPPHKVCFEITESMAITHLDNTQNFIDKFRALGCRFALDDFGTGFSSYAYLKDLNIDYLKIDGVFVKNLCDDAVNTAMIKSIADVASAIGIETIAEFVETAEIQDKLTEIGITYSQGYHIHKPVKLDSLALEESRAQPNSHEEGNS
ncbi:EAL domain-containing protein, partial [Oleiphilus sp. HI0123]